MEGGSRTKIVATLGPASHDRKIIEKMIRAGLDVARLNFSHGSHEDHAILMKEVRAASKAAGTPVAILQDLQGPKIRIGKIGLKGVLCRARDVLTLVAVRSRETEGDDADEIPVIYPYLARDAKLGDRILIDDGAIICRVTKVKRDRVEVTIVRGGTITSGRGVSLPDAELSVRALTHKDRLDAAFGVENGVDWICLSYVTSKKDIEDLRKIVKDEAKKHRLRPPLVMAKIERRAALPNVNDIIELADGIMLGRGDLGVEIPLEEVPIIQKDITERCRIMGKPVIVATQMLESMRKSPSPTRAEMSDIANAVFDHADAVMLSAETATGDYPVEAVAAMSAVIRESEASRFAELHFDLADVDCLPSTLALSVALLAKRGLIDAIAVTTNAAEAAAAITRFRPTVPIILAVPDEAAARAALLRSGVSPLIVANDPDGRFIRHLRDVTSLKKGAKVALIRLGDDGQHPTFEVRTV